MSKLFLKLAYINALFIKGQKKRKVENKKISRKLVENKKN